MPLMVSPARTTWGWPRRPGGRRGPPPAAPPAGSFRTWPIRIRFGLVRALALHERGDRRAVARARWCRGCRRIGPCRCRSRRSPPRGDDELLPDEDQVRVGEAVGRERLATVVSLARGDLGEGVAPAAPCRRPVLEQREEGQANDGEGGACSIVGRAWRSSKGLRPLGRETYRCPICPTTPNCPTSHSQRPASAGARSLSGSGGGRSARRSASRRSRLGSARGRRSASPRPRRGGRPARR